jgi:predicted acylesterase/phospholipase RssA
MGFYHVGVVKALLTEGLLPRVISGASAGSLMAAMIGTYEYMFMFLYTNFLVFVSISF